MCHNVICKISSSLALGFFGAVLDERWGHVGCCIYKGLPKGIMGDVAYLEIHLHFTSEYKFSAHLLVPSKISPICECMNYTNIIAQKDANAELE